MTIWGARTGRWMATATAMACAALATTAAKAEWREARGRHFILYGNMPEDTLRTMATRLEQFDGAMRQLHSLAQQEGEERSVPRRHPQRQKVGSAALEDIGAAPSVAVPGWVTLSRIPRRLLKTGADVADVDL